MAENQLTELQYNILKVIEASAEPITARPIREQLGLDQRGIGGATRAILKRDYVKIEYREGNVASGYVRFYAITSSGRDALAAYEAQPPEAPRAGWKEWQQRFYDEYERQSVNYQSRTSEPNPLSFAEWMDMKTDFALQRESTQIGYDFWQQRNADMAELIGYMSAALEAAQGAIKSDVVRDGVERALARYEEWVTKLKRK